jgi:hypothetical protein
VPVPARKALQAVKEAKSPCLGRRSGRLLATGVSRRRRGLGASAGRYRQAWLSERLRTTRNNNRTAAIKAPQLGSTSRRKHTLQQGCAFSAYACALADPAAQAELVHALPLLNRVCWETSTRQARLASSETSSSMQRTRLAPGLVHALPQYCWETSTRRARLASSETSMQRAELADCGWTQV